MNYDEANHEQIHERTEQRAWPTAHRLRTGNGIIQRAGCFCGCRRSLPMPSKLLSKVPTNSINRVRMPQETITNPIHNYVFYSLLRGISSCT